jgi:hypothetical protein
VALGTRMDKIRKPRPVRIQVEYVLTFLLVTRHFIFIQKSTLYIIFTVSFLIYLISVPCSSKRLASSTGQYETKLWLKKELAEAHNQLPAFILLSASRQYSSKNYSENKE